MGVCSAHLVLALAAVAVAVVGLNIDGDPIVDDSAMTPSIVIQVWGTVGSASTTDQTDIETNRIPQKKKPQTLRKLIPNYDFPVVPVVIGKSPPRPQPVVHLCRRPPRPLGWSWRLWVRGRGRPRFNVGDKLGPLSGEEGTGAKEVGIDGKLGKQLEDKTTRRPYTKHVDIGRALGAEAIATRRPNTKHVDIGAKLGEVLLDEGEEVEEEEAVDEKVIIS